MGQPPEPIRFDDRRRHASPALLQRTHMGQLSLALSYVLLASLAASAAAAGGRLLQGPPPSSSPSPSPSTSSNKGYPFDWPSYLANPYSSPGSASCSDPVVGNFPSSYWATQGKMPKPFTQLYKDPPSCKNFTQTKSTEVGSTLYEKACVTGDASCNSACSKTTCMDGYQFDVVNITQKFGLWDDMPGCQGGTELLGYGGIVPACTVEAMAGTQVLLRMINKIQYTKNILPHEQNIHPCNGEFSNKTKSYRYGRPFSVHHHGSASLAPYDGWASDEVCYGETKDYVYPANRAGTGWYHDHALDITAANAYWGLAGQFVVQNETIEQQWGLTNMIRRHLILSDKVFTKECQLLKDETGYHKDNLYGDVNLVSGIPWPLDYVAPAWYRFHVLSAGISRPFHIKLMGRKDGASKLDDVNAVLNGPACYIIAGDGGYRKSPIPYPTTGLFMGVAERYEFVCDFAKLKAANYNEIYLYNHQDTNRMKEVPFFCLSHLLMKFVINQPVPTDYSSQPPTFATAMANIKYDTVVENVLTPLDISSSRTRAQSGQYDRYFKFEHSNGQWVINGETWFTHRVAADDVGTNTYEVWKLETGGGWFHPIHIHLVDFYVLYRTSGSYPQTDTYELDVPKDVVMLFPGAQVYILARFGAHKGEYMFHCHNLIHEDMAMLRSFNESTYNTMKFNMEKGSYGAAFKNITAPEYMDDRLDPNGVTTLYDQYWQADECDHAYAAPSTDPKWKVGPDGGLTKEYLTEQIMEGKYRLFYPLKRDPPQYCNANINKWLIPKQC